MSIEWNSLCICCVYRVYTQTYLNFSRSLYVITLFSSSCLSMSAQFLYSSTLYFFFFCVLSMVVPKNRFFGIFNHSYFTFNFHLLSNALVNTWCYLYTEYLPPFLLLILFYIERLIHTFSISLDFHLLALARAYNVYCVHMDGWMNILYIMFILNELIFWSFFWGD